MIPSLSRRPGPPDYQPSGDNGMSDGLFSVGEFRHGSHFIPPDGGTAFNCIAETYCNLMLSCSFDRPTSSSSHSAQSSPEQSSRSTLCPSQPFSIAGPHPDSAPPYHYASLHSRGRHSRPGTVCLTVPSSGIGSSSCRPRQREVSRATPASLFTRLLQCHPQS